MPEQLTITVHTSSPDETRSLGARLAARLGPGAFVALIGPLGSGKTCFVQGLAAGLGVQGNVSSPTFILARYHPGNPGLCHADAYRLAEPADLEQIGLQDYLEGSVVAVEWAERVQASWPPQTVVIRLQPHDNQRTITLLGSPDQLGDLAPECEK